MVISTIGFIIQALLNEMATVAQLVRASDCGPEGRGFEPHQSPHYWKWVLMLPIFFNLFESGFFYKQWQDFQKNKN